MENDRFPSAFPIRIPMRAGYRTPAGRTAFEALPCSPALPPPLGSHNTYHTSRRKATDSFEEGKIFLRKLLLSIAVQILRRVNTHRAIHRPARCAAGAAWRFQSSPDRSCASPHLPQSHVSSQTTMRSIRISVASLICTIFCARSSIVGWRLGTHRVGVITAEGIFC